MKAMSICNNWNFCRKCNTLYLKIRTTCNANLHKYKSLPFFLVCMLFLGGWGQGLVTSFGKSLEIVINTKVFIKPKALVLNAAYSVILPLMCFRIWGLMPYFIFFPPFVIFSAVIFILYKFKKWNFNYNHSILFLNEHH